MCGIVGAIDPTAGGRPEALANIATAMAETLAHRGPDDSGVWVDAEAGVALGHRRLAVVDLSPTGHQPMISHSGRFVLTYNGEVYNHPELRRRLQSEGVSFRGTSDTEVLLAAIEGWGLPAALKAADGMFALALWDRRDRTLTLARDRIGEKPLYHGRIGKAYLFGSELKALRCHPAFRAEVDREALALYLRHGYVPCPRSIYTGIAKLPPGTWLRISAEGRPQVPEPYWRLADAVERGMADPFRGTLDEAADQVEALLRRSVAGRMVADVPVGVFLSGGIDSSTVTAIMAAQSDRPVKTFSIGFTEEGFDEAVAAAKVAAHLGTDHHEQYVPATEALGVIPELPRFYDEPFGDSSQIPTMILARRTRREVTVALSGDGGDELFGGYPRYRMLDVLSRVVDRVPGAIRRAAAGMLTAPSAGTWETLGRALPGRLRTARLADRAVKLAAVLGAGSAEGVYAHLVGLWADPDVAEAVGAPAPISVLPDSRGWGDAGSWAMFADSLTYLPDDILVKVDRATMATSLETRIPLLDHRLIEFAWRLPPAYRLHRGEGKRVLRQVLHRYVPPPLVDRPKMGFGIPVGAWLRGPLRPWAEDLLDPAHMAHTGLFDAEPARRLWTEHLSGGHNHQYLLWDVLMAQAWAGEREPVVAGGWPPA